MKILRTVAALAALVLSSSAAGAAVMSASISSTSASNLSGLLHLQPKESLTWTVTGTATGTVVIDWSTNLQQWNDAGVSVVGVGPVSRSGVLHTGPQEAWYRFRVSTITAGTFVVSMADNDDFVAEWRNNKGQPILRIFDETIKVMGNFYRTGADYIGTATPSKVMTTADQSTTSTSTGAVTGLSFPVEANRSYMFEFVAFSSAAATSTGIKLAVTGPTGSSSIVGYHIATSATAIAFAVIADGSAYTAATSAGTTLVPNLVKGTITVGATPGNLALNFGSEVNASGVTIKAGSYGTIR
jgi:hypothetical protein